MCAGRKVLGITKRTLFQTCYPYLEDSQRPKEFRANESILKQASAVNSIPTPTFELPCLLANSRHVDIISFSKLYASQVMTFTHVGSCCPEQTN